ncbi:hypothetical protein [Ferrimicrobium sp.]|uniref:hypothetical protein n=1 Tax=Ferrimicrobium sp. TaxID=2926050 RepID=UPI0027E40AE8|nr:hypothetical protein [Ferrimicrobium sp.]
MPCLITVSLDEHSYPKYMRATPVDAWDQLEVTKRVLDMVDVNATVKTDGMGGFDDLSDMGYTHIQTISARLGEDEHFSPVLQHPDREPEGPDAGDIPSSAIEAPYRVISR